MRQMILVGFLQAQNCSNLASSWRHPESRQDSTSAAFYTHIGRVLEDAKFHMAFFDDRLSMPDHYGHDHAHAVQHGIRCVKMDPVTILTAIGMKPSKLGLAATYSTTYYEPFHVARVFATLDLMTEGRCAWNVVTSLNDGEAMNMGYAESLPHDLRYDRADEFMRVVLGHWDSWADDAIIQDRVTGLYADPTKVSRLDHVGKFFRSRGPFTVPRSPQGHPVIIQAGQSGRGRRFAARWGEVIFVAYQDLPSARTQYAEMKREASSLGRDPDALKIATMIYTVAGATKSEAEDKMAIIERLPLEIDALSLLSEALNFDFATKGMDDPFTPEELEAMTGFQGLRDRVLRAAGKPNPTVREFIRFSGRGRPNKAIVGGPKEIADQLEAWFVEPACDGFVLAATHVPGSYEDFATHVVPELQRRGLFRTEYAGTTLRENLGLERPRIGEWNIRETADAT